jgi:hypothetical protein
MYSTTDLSLRCPSARSGGILRSRQNQEAKVASVKMTPFQHFWIALNAVRKASGLPEALLGEAHEGWEQFRARCRQAR